MTAYTTSQFTVRFTLRNKNGTPFNLTTMALEMRISIGGGASSIIPINTTNQRLRITDAVNGVFELVLTASDMGNFTARVYQYEVGQSNNANGYLRLFGGRITVRQGVPA